MVTLKVYSCSSLNPYRNCCTDATPLHAVITSNKCCKDGQIVSHIIYLMLNNDKEKQKRKHSAKPVRHVYGFDGLIFFPNRCCDWWPPNAKSLSNCFQNLIITAPTLNLRSSCLYLYLSIILILVLSLSLKINLN